LNTGRILVEYQSNTGQILVKYSTPSVVRHHGAWVSAPVDHASDVELAERAISILIDDSRGPLAVSDVLHDCISDDYISDASRGPVTFSDILHDYISDDYISDD
jgi:hypothetical protein